jgi:hypothetical protein
MYAIAVVLLNALSFASLAYIANRKGHHTMAALAAAGAWLFGQRVADLGLALMSRRFPPPWSVDEADSNLERASSRLFRGLGPPQVALWWPFAASLSLKWRSDHADISTDCLRVSRNHIRPCPAAGQGDGQSTARGPSQRPIRAINSTTAL